MNLIDQRRLRRFVPLFFTALLSLALLKFASTPYIWIALAWVSGFVVVAILEKAPNARAAAICCATTAALFGGFEAYYAYQTAAELAIHRATSMDEHGNRLRFSMPHRELGYAARPNADARLSVTENGELLYRTNFRIGANGLRVSPPDIGGRDIPCVLFFGGSMTFGVGVEDEDAVHYRVGELTDGRYRTYNFGLNGYGPHQMLAALESEVVEKIVDCRPMHIIYQAIPHHAIRAAGRARWDKRGPRYLLDQAGRAVRRGNFNDSKDRNEWPGKRLILNQLDKSSLYRTLIRNRIRTADLELVVAIVKASQRFVAALYPDASFHVVLRADSRSFPGRELSERLQTENIRVHPIDAIIPAPGFDAPEYRVHPKDPHPNARAHDLLARFVVEQILDGRH